MCPIFVFLLSSLEGDTNKWEGAVKSQKYNCSGACNQLKGGLQNNVSKTARDKL